MEIIATPDKRLRIKSNKVKFDDPETMETIAKMRNAVEGWEKKHPHETTVAMAAPQLGINKRIIIMREDEKSDHFVALINPEVIKTEGKMIEDMEGCLSVPFIYGKIKRPEKIKIKALTETGEDVRLKAEGFLARTLLHEIDHLDGVLFIDHIKNDKKAFFKIDNKTGELEPVDYDLEIKNNKDLFPDE